MSEQHEPDQRFTLANERTFLAWVRTALGLVAASLFVLHLVERDALSIALALLLLAGAAIAVVGGWLRYRGVDRAMRAGQPLPAAPAAPLLAAAVLLAVLAVSASAFL